MSIEALHTYSIKESKLKESTFDPLSQRKNKTNIKDFGDISAGKEQRRLHILMGFPLSCSLHVLIFI